MTRRKRSFFHRHGLSIVAAAILALWIALYIPADDKTHWGSFFGNAIADWTGMVVMILATKVLYERGSKESKKPPHPLVAWIPDSIRAHDLSIFVVLTGCGWVIAFAHMDPSGHWGRVVGNIVSEWTQILGIVILTKFLVERGSQESG